MLDVCRGQAYLYPLNPTVEGATSHIETDNSSMQLWIRKPCAREGRWRKFLSYNNLTSRLGAASGQLTCSNHTNTVDKSVAGILGCKLHRWLG